MRQLKADGSKGRAHGAAERAAPATAHSGPVLLSGVGIPRMRDTAERQALPPAFMRGEGHAVAGGVPRRGGESLLSHGFAVPAPPEGKPRVLRTVLAPRIYEGGGPRSGRGSPPRGGGNPLSHASRASSPKGRAKGASRRSCPPAFMRGEGHAVAGGVLRGGGESLLSHGFAVPAPPEGKPRALRAVLAPRIYEGGGPRSGRGSSPAAAAGTLSVTAAPCQLPQRGSRGRFAPFLPPAFMRGEGHAVAGGVPPPQRGRSHATGKYLPLHKNAGKWEPCAHFSPVNRASSFPAFSLCPSRP